MSEPTPGTDTPQKHPNAISRLEHAGPDRGKRDLCCPAGHPWRAKYRVIAKGHRMYRRRDKNRQTGAQMYEHRLEPSNCPRCGAPYSMLIHGGAQPSNEQ